jgi:hypothetical protein
MLCEANQRSWEELFKNKCIIIIFQTLCVDIFKNFYCDFLCGIIFKIIFIEKQRCFLTLAS